MIPPAFDYHAPGSVADAITVRTDLDFDPEEIALLALTSAPRQAEATERAAAIPTEPAAHTRDPAGCVAAETASCCTGTPDVLTWR